jgi:HK97 family phage major capsid protein
MAARYRAMSTEDLHEARENLLVRMEDDTDEGVVDEADACGAEIEARQRVAQRRARLAQGLRDQHVVPGHGVSGVQPRGQRVGEDAETRTTADVQLTESAGWAQFTRNGYQGMFSPEVSSRALLTTTTFPTAERIPGVVGPTVDRVQMIDYVPVAQTSSTKIEYVAETAASQSGVKAGAHPVAEGAAKPEATLTFQPDSVNVETIATWVQASRQAVDDDSSATQWLSARLTRAIRASLGEQCVTGDGTSPNLRGLLATPGIQTITGAAGEDLATVARRAMTKLQLFGFVPNLLVVNPADAEAADLTTGVPDGAWRDDTPLHLPERIVDPWLAVGKFVIGDFAAANIALRLRQQATLIMSDSHVDNFIKNIIVLLAEMRAALAVYSPAAFVVGTLTAAAGNGAAQASAPTKSAKS